MILLSLLARGLRPLARLPSGCGSLATRPLWGELATRRRRRPRRRRARGGRAAQKPRVLGTLNRVQSRLPRPPSPPPAAQAHRARCARARRDGTSRKCARKMRKHVHCLFDNWSHTPGQDMATNRLRKVIKKRSTLDGMPRKRSFGLLFPQHPRRTLKHVHFQ
jgi:hypothetical protein